MANTNLSTVELKQMRDAFSRCLNANYIHVEDDGDFAIETKENTLFFSDI